MFSAKESLIGIVCFLCCASVIVVAISSAGGEKSNDLDQFKYCIRQAQRPSLQECIGRTAISFLQRFEEKDNFTLAADLVSTKDDKLAGRSIVNFLDTDPVDFRGILENAGAVISQRSMEWHMDAIYPGLMFKIGPSASANSIAEFVIDPSALDERNFPYEETSTARLLAGQYLLPFLLGLKFNLVALVPLLFAGITLLLKKSLFFAKLAIYVSSFLGIGGAVSAVSSAGGLAGLSGLGGLGVGNIGVPFAAPQTFGVNGGGGGGGGGGGTGLGAAGGGYFPSKTTVFNQHYDVDELHHNSPYKRTDRKVNFDKPREYVSRPTLPATAERDRNHDRFYEYEKPLAMPREHAGTTRIGSGGKLGPSAYDEDEEEAKRIRSNFKPSTSLGWKVVDLRIKGT